MRKQTLLPSLFLTAAVLAAGCGEDGDESFYRIESPPMHLAMGTIGEVRIRFVAKKGYHWNGEYPARFEITGDGGLKSEKTLLKKNDFRKDGDAGLLPLTVTGVKGGETLFRGKASFSVCNPKECRIFRGIEVKVPVRVQ